MAAPAACCRGGSRWGRIHADIRAAGSTRRCGPGMAMERPIAYDRLAREDRFVRMRARRLTEFLAEQGLSPCPDLLPAVGR